MPSPTVAPVRDTRPVAGYVRVSTVEQEVRRQEETIPTAHSRLPDGLAENALELFDDHGISGYDPTKTRPGYEAMMARLRARGFSALIIDTSSRLTRQGIREALTIFFDLQDAGTRLFTTQGREYAFDLAGIISLIVDAEKDNAYSRDLSHNTSTGIRAIASAGYWPYGPAPFGYDARPDPDHPNGWRVLVPNQDAPLVKKALVRFAFDQGASLSSIARAIGQSRVNTSKIIDNPVYAGFICCKGETFPGRQEPLVSEAIYELAQKRRRANAKIQARYPRVHPYGSLLRCPDCDKPTHYHQSGKSRGGRNNTYYRCENPVCRKYVAIPEHVDVAVALGLYSTALTLHERLDDPEWAVTAPKDDERAHVEAELARLRAAENDILELILSRTLDKEAARPKLEEIADEREHLESDRARLAGDGKKLRNDLEILRNRLFSLKLDVESPTHESLVGFLAAWHAADIEEKRWFLHDTLVRIELHDGKLPNPAVPWDKGYLDLTFKAGITIPIPFVSGRRDQLLSAPLREAGFGRPGTEPPSSFSLLRPGAPVARRMCRYRREFTPAFRARPGSRPTRLRGRRPAASRRPSHARDPATRSPRSRRSRRR